MAENSGAPQARSGLSGWSRRRFIAAIGGTSLAVAIAPSALADPGHHGPGGRPGGRPGGFGGGHGRDQRPDRAVVGFYGDHQAGVTNPAPERLVFTSFDVTAPSRSSLVDLLRTWTTTAAGLVAASDPRSALTLTLGFGPSLFRTADGRDRYGIASLQPASLGDLPLFRGDAIDPARSAGDLCVQVCAASTADADAAVQALSRATAGGLQRRWTQAGFGKPSTAPPQETGRNLMGFKDGTANIQPFDTAAHQQWVWAQGSDGTAWMHGGTYLAVRRIVMDLPAWDAEPTTDQERVFGRFKASGAPLTGGDERTRPDFRAIGTDGQPVIARDAHINLASPGRNDGVRILRRGYNFADRADDSGLLFLGFVRDLNRQFVPMQSRLAESDLLNEYITTRGSAAFAIPPGVPAPGGFVGQTLLVT